MVEWRWNTAVEMMALCIPRQKTRSLLPLTCLMHRSAYFSVLSVLDFPLLLFSDGRCIFRSFSVLNSSFCVLALADCSLLQGSHGTRHTCISQHKHSGSVANAVTCVEPRGFKARRGTAVPGLYLSRQGWG